MCAVTEDQAENESTDGNADEVQKPEAEEGEGKGNKSCMTFACNSEFCQ